MGNISFTFQGNFFKGKPYMPTYFAFPFLYGYKTKYVKRIWKYENSPLPSIPKSTICLELNRKGQ